MQNIAKKHLRNSVNFQHDGYPRERDNALRYGLTALNVVNYLREIKNLLRDRELPNITCVKEILYLYAKYFLNPYQVLRLTRVNHFEYFKNNLLNPDGYLDNIIPIPNIRHKERLERWRDEAQQIENLDQLIGIAISSFREITSRLTQEIPITTTRTTTLTRSQVRGEIEQGRLRITRKNEMVDRYSGLRPEEVADRISNLLRHHGEGLVNTHDTNHILTCSERYYTAWMVNPNINQIEIIGSIAVNRNTGEITNLVVDRRFRRLGIANRLLENVLNLNLPRYITCIRKNNGASLNLFRSRGFTAHHVLDRLIVLFRENRGS